MTKTTLLVIDYDTGATFLTVLPEWFEHEDGTVVQLDAKNMSLIEDWLFHAHNMTPNNYSWVEFHKLEVR